MIVPLSRTGIVIGSIFVITIVMGDFVTVGVMGGQQIASVGKIIQVQTSYLQFPLAAANAVVLLAVVLMIIVALTRLVDLRMVDLRAESASAHVPRAVLRTPFLLYFAAALPGARLETSFARYRRNPAPLRLGAAGRSVEEVKGERPSEDGGTERPVAPTCTMHRA